LIIIANHICYPSEKSESEAEILALRRELEILKDQNEKLKEECNCKDIIIANQRRIIRTTRLSRRYEQSRKLHWLKQNSCKKKQIDDIKQSMIESKKSHKEEKKRLLKPFSAAQIRCLQSRSGRARWSSNDISKAVVLRAISNKGYNYARLILQIPLPSVSCLHEWTRRIDFQSGRLMEAVLKMMQHQLQPSTRLSRQAAICFDEMNIDSRLEYDPATDSILGLCSGMMVVFVRAIFDSWKQPVFYAFEKCLSLETLTGVSLNTISYILYTFKTCKFTHELSKYRS